MFRLSKNRCHNRNHRRYRSNLSRNRTIVASESRMERFKTVWEGNDPDTLTDIAARYCVRNPETYSILCKNIDGVEVPVSKPKKPWPLLDSDEDDDHEDVDPSTYLKLIDGIQLPSIICEKMFSMAREEGLDINDRFVNVFGDTTRTKLRSVSVRGSSITDVGLSQLLKHKLRELDIHNCLRLSKACFDTFNETSENLVNLTVGNSEQILPDYIPGDTFEDGDEEEEEEELDDEDEGMKMYQERGYILIAPKLVRLCIRDLYIQRGGNFMSLLLRPLGDNLTHLDLSGLSHKEGLGDFHFFEFTKELVSLVLHNVLGLDTAVTALRQLKKLKHLDLSQNVEKGGIYHQPDDMLKEIVQALPNLESLDISGTNLAGSGIYDSKDGEEDDNDIKCDIMGLKSRINKPLEFLGLYKTDLGASARTHIPAKKISGDSNESQIITAGQHYLDRPKEMENVLNDLFHLFRYEVCNNLKAALDVILLTMDKHPKERIIQISGSASLYYVVISQIQGLFNVKMKRKIIVTLLNGMFRHKHDPVMMRNGCITLCQFAIPKDLLFDYERLVRILLFIVSQHNDSENENDFVERAGIFLLNSLACQVDGQQKLLVGNLGAMERMLDLIRAKVNNYICDDVMETAWSTMWNVTDETPINCKRFLDAGGMHLFLECKTAFPEKQDLLRNMMGLLGNVAEVPHLRSKLMTKEFVAEFFMLLDSNSDGIEVSYNAAGVLAHMASDGPEAWTIDYPSREHVLSKMVSAISRWNLDTKRNINYRSFEPILRLVMINHTPQCQHWAVWALANLTRVDIKYCSLIEQEGGLKLLDELINGNVPTVPYQRVIELASIVRDNVTRWKIRQNEDDSDGLDG